MKYAHSASAFKNFSEVTSKAAYKTTSQPQQQTADDDAEEALLSDEVEEEGATSEALELGDVEMDDLLADKEEFAPGTRLWIQLEVFLVFCMH